MSSFLNSQTGKALPTDTGIISLAHQSGKPDPCLFRNNNADLTCHNKLFSGSSECSILAAPYALGIDGDWHRCIDGFSGNALPGRFSGAEVVHLLDYFSEWRGCPIRASEFEAAVDDAIALCQSEVQL